VFLVDLVFPTSYPYSCPSVKFNTEVFHPNVSEVGVPCVDVLGPEWTAAHSVYSIAASLQSLLCQPDPHHPVHPHAAALYLHNPTRYAHLVRMCVRNATPSEKAGAPTCLTLEEVRELQNQTHFNSVELQDLYREFETVAKEVAITKDMWDKTIGLVGLKDRMITDRLFEVFDKDQSGAIDFSEFVGAMSVLCRGSWHEKLKCLFDLCDIDKNGFISKAELCETLRASLKSGIQAAGELHRKLSSSNVLKRSTEMIQQTEQTNDEDTHPKRKRKKNPKEKEEEPFAPRFTPDAPRRTLSYSGQWATRTVDQIFSEADADKDDQISWDDFKKWAPHNPNMLKIMRLLGPVG